MNLENRLFYRFVVFSRIMLISLSAIGCISFALWNLAPNDFQCSKIVSYWESAVDGTVSKYCRIPTLSPVGAEINYMTKINSNNYNSMTAEEKKNITELLEYTEYEILSTSFIGFIIFYVLLNLFCNGLLYLAFGKKPSWKWILFLKSKKVKALL